MGSTFEESRACNFLMNHVSPCRLPWKRKIPKVVFNLSLFSKKQETGIPKGNDRDPRDPLGIPKKRITGALGIPTREP